jgi:hypothetical protein
MTADTATTAPPQVGAPAPRRRRALGWLGWSLIVVLALLLVTVAGILLAGSGTNSTPLHPANPEENGTMAMAEVLADQDISVRAVKDYQALIDSGPSPSDTVVITATSPLSAAAAQQLVPILQQAGRVVVVVDDFNRIADLQLPVELINSGYYQELPGRCPGDVLPAAATVSNLASSFVATDPDWRGCFVAEGGNAVMFGPYGQSTAVVVGATDFATNGNILGADNAQLALWLYGSTPQLLWYQPDPNDVVYHEPPGSEVELAPDWFAPVMVLLGFAVVALMIARGVRFGPLSKEPMPVVVSALETTRIRGRLYRGAGDIAHSAELLRAAAVRRLARRVGLPGNADGVLVAARLSNAHPTATALLTGPLPTTADEAVRWLHDLRRLEDEVADD